MRKLILVLLPCILILACKSEPKQNEQTEDVMEVKNEPIASITADMMENAIIYEANIRQYSPEGSFNAFTKDIPELKKLGVKIIWVMPIFPISEIKRKATGDKFASDIEDPEERKKYLGSYYAVSDYRNINPEFGTIEDFRKLVKTAHDNGIYVILDWVPNHTGWDHTWIKTNPEFYTKNENGEITDPINKNTGESWGWTDTADLNYGNGDMRQAMINDMMHWLTEEGIDGFRCDVAAEVPTDFWERAIPELRAKKNIFMLAEAWEPELLNGDLFDMAYGWDRHHTMNHIAKGESKVKEWDDQMEKDARRYNDNDILMTFVTNHDENSWNGSVKERMGEAGEVFTALSYLAPGMPLIYSGQEYGMNHRLKFFEKDSIPKTKGKMWTVLERLGKLKSISPALHGGKNAASYKRIQCDNDNVLQFERNKNGVTLTFLANLSAKDQSFSNTLDGKFLNYMTDLREGYHKNSPKIDLKPWEYKILIH